MHTPFRRHAPGSQPRRPALSPCLVMTPSTHLEIYPSLTHWHGACDCATGVPTDVLLNRRSMIPDLDYTGNASPGYRGLSPRGTPQR